MKKKEVIVAIYIRVSTLDQAREGYSLKMQEQTLREWCKEKGYIIYDLYADRGISGKDFNHRPDMLRLMRDAKDGCFNSVVFKGTEKLPFLLKWKFFFSIIFKSLLRKIIKSYGLLHSQLF